MKSKENNLEKNIARLVKLTGDSNKPSEAFADSVVKDALDELKGAKAGRKREGNGKFTKVKWPKIFAYAASIIIVSGVVVALTVPRLKLARDGKVSWSQIRGKGRTDADKGTSSLSAFSPSSEASKKEAARSHEAYKYDTDAASTPVTSTGRAKSSVGQSESKVSGSGIVDESSVTQANLKVLPPTQVAMAAKQHTEPSVGLDMISIRDDGKLEGKTKPPVPILGDKDIKGRPTEIAKIVYKDGADKFDVYAKAKKEEVNGPEALALKSLGGGAGGGGAGRKPAFVVVGTPRSVGLDITVTDAKSAPRVVCRPSEPGPGGYPMAHGGTTPPNGEDVDGMFFKNYGVNPFVDTEDDHLSTFATDVDTGSYTIVRGYLQDGHLPPEKAVRVEEFVNYFKYNYPAPQEDVFEVYAEAAPWKFGTGRKNSYLLRLGLKAKRVSEENRKPAILTFVIDVSGSMRRENRLGLVKKCLRMLIERLRPEDKIGIAVYGSRGRKVMEHKGLDEKDEILAVIESLHASGSTFAEEGIRIGYEMAESGYKKRFINRVILCSDGVANVGQTGADDILEVIKKKAEKGITLSAIGFGVGNYNDVLLERLGDKGNGHYVYIDTIAEARRIFEDNLTGTLQVVGRDVKVQVDFNPKVVRSYRLIGYENRDVPDEKFRDDKYDGGEVGAGHSVTALYELKLWPDKNGTVATTYVRYKHADTSAVTEFKSPMSVRDFDESFDDSSSEFKLAATVAEFAEILRKSYWAKGATLERVLERAQQLSREFKGDADVIELVDLISKAKRLMKKADVKPNETEEDAN
jgi:Ca-activated chloride channel family protein